MWQRVGIGFGVWIETCGCETHMEPSMTTVYKGGFVQDLRGACLDLLSEGKPPHDVLTWYVYRGRSEYDAQVFWRVLLCSWFAMLCVQDISSLLYYSVECVDTDVFVWRSGERKWFLVLWTGL